MNVDEEVELKKEFQLERVILFSDAVFAIIITIMVLDIRLPDDFKHATLKEAQKEIIHLIPKVFAYCISFFLVARFWRNHLRMFSLLKDYDNKLLGFNLFYLFSISMFPFAVTLISGTFDIYSIQYAIAVYFYASILFLSIFTETLLSRYLMINRARLCVATESLDAILKYKALRLNLYIIPVLYVGIICLIYFGINAVFVIITFSLYGVAMKRINKIYYPAKDSKGPILSRLYHSGQKIFRPRRNKKQLIK